MQERWILHCDINHCYAQIEEMKVPALRKVAMAVGGHEESRHGIILAKNDLAKQYKIKTGESLREARAKCPHLMIIHPHYDDYLYYTEKVKDIYREYSDQVESFGLDEAWIDVSGMHLYYSDATIIAQEIQKRVLEECGLTISIGVSFNKIFAKLGSDFNKQMGLTVISRENYRQLAWKLDVDQLLFVGRATAAKLHVLGILTIGQLANCEVETLKSNFGKVGEMIWWFANGYDSSEVRHINEADPVKSVGNGITTPKDINSMAEALLVFRVLSESVASRCRDIQMRGSCVSVHLRSTSLKTISRQRKIEKATNVSEEIMKVIKVLLSENQSFQYPYRSVTLTLSSLEEDRPIQQENFFSDEAKREEVKQLEITMEEIRNRFGFNSIKKCSMLLDEELCGFNPKAEHIIFPVGYKT